ncbi:hypothetical protein HanIR_Chr16g0838721 [Helianthus annuus]|nr:hypothetical protein HanIR_Chr16g0838721 [Helianthus annuus]
MGILPAKQIYRISYIRTLYMPTGLSCVVNVTQTNGRFNNNLSKKLKSTNKRF